jgi:hypothetical protein
MENKNDENVNDEPSVPTRDEISDKPTVGSTPIVEVRNPVGRDAPKGLTPPGAPPTTSPPARAVDDRAKPVAKDAAPATPPAP